MNKIETVKIPVSMAVFHGKTLSSGANPVLGNPGEPALVPVPVPVPVPPVPVPVPVPGVVGGVGVGVVGGVGAGAVTHTGLVIVFVSNVTAPFRANILPSTSAPVVRVMDVKARIFPLKLEFVPSVAELPTCQKTLQAWAPFMRRTRLDPAVMSVEAVLKIKTALGSSWASSVSVPVIPNVPAAES